MVEKFVKDLLYTPLKSTSLRNKSATFIKILKIFNGNFDFRELRLGRVKSADSESRAWATFQRGRAGKPISFTGIGEGQQPNWLGAKRAFSTREQSRDNLFQAFVQWSEGTS